MIEKLVEKADILIEALPYIRRFRGKEILIKYGGSAMVDDEVRAHVLHDIVFMNYVGIRPILIHGGGPAITANLKQAGIKTRFNDGLRVTDKQTIGVVVETLASLNQSMVHDIHRYGARAEGLSGHHAKIFRVVKHRSNADMGYVGEVVAVDFSVVRKLTENDIVPVIYPVGADEAGAVYNVNADEAAAKLAAAMQVQKIMILTNVQGIMKSVDDPASLASSLHAETAEEMIDSKLIRGGMIPKVRAGISALRGGVKKAHVVDGRIKHSILLEIFTDKGIGTEIEV